MTDQEITRLIAEKVCGATLITWKQNRRWAREREAWQFPNGAIRFLGGSYDSWQPCESLDDAAVAEAQLTVDKWIAYEEYLTDAVRDLCTMDECADLGYRMITADPRMRCECLLRAVGIAVKE